ncbi:hypothetical protein FB451DRAFT_1207722 [Mycena latifolia]|nr:hypothetical protein FB451DRAFT_1207722 [Mycena latifolia]
MRFTISFLALALSLVTLASAQSCTADGKAGICKDTSQCHSPEFKHIAGHCPGPADFQCCVATSVESCTANGKGGTCEFTSQCISPEFEHIAGHCPGPTDYQCCIATGCVICPGGKKRDLEERRPCCF